MRRFQKTAVALAGVMLSLLLSPTVLRAEAQTETWQEVRSACASRSGDTLSINVLILVDASTSLRSTDPNELRVRGVVRAARTLEELATRYADAVRIQVAVDGFSTDYYRYLGWVSPDEASAALDTEAMRNDVARTIRWTNYVGALRGAARRFAETTEGDCNLLVWFTDGEHDTVDAGVLVEEESNALDRLCNSDINVEQLTDRHQVTTLAVMLSHPDYPSDVAPLQKLFGARGDCANPLVGRIQTYDGIAALGEQLDEIIGETLAGSICTPRLPGEMNECNEIPPEAETATCSVDAASQECVYSFNLGDNDEAFRVYVDQTALNRGITAPEEIFFRLVSPSGALSSPIGSAGRGQESWQLIEPFNFWAFQPYDSRWQIVGHRAALSAGEEWGGVWRLEFWGATERGRQDAQRVAAATRTIQAQEPEVIDLRITTEGALVGYLLVQSDASEVISYGRLDVFVALQNEGGLLFYETRSRNTGYLSNEPTPLSEVDNQFVVPSVGEKVRSWDNDYAQRVMADNCAVEGGGKIYNHLQRGGSVLMATVLERDFAYGPPGNLLSWTTQNTSLDISEDLMGAFQPRDDALSSAAAKCSQRQTLVQWLNNTQEPPLPETATLEVQQRSTGPSVTDPQLFTYEVLISGGLLPWRASIAEFVVESFEPETTPTYDQDFHTGWICESSAVEPPWGVVASESSIRCHLVDLVIAEDGTTTVRLAVTVTAIKGARLTAYLDEIEWWKAPSEAQEQLEALISNHSTLVVEPASVTVVFPRPPEPVIPRPREPVFLGLVILLVVVAVCLRIVRATRMRRWKPLLLPDYLIIPLDGQEPETRNVCPDLVRKAAQADLIHAKLRSRLWPLLLGQRRRIIAKAEGACCSSGEVRIKHAKRQAVDLGDSLSVGWLAVVGADGHDRLLVWDLPPEDNFPSGTSLPLRLSSLKVEAGAKLAELKRLVEDAEENDGDLLASQRRSPMEDGLADDDPLVE